MNLGGVRKSVNIKFHESPSSCSRIIPSKRADRLKIRQDDANSVFTNLQMCLMIRSLVSAQCCVALIMKHVLCQLECDFGFSGCK
jgi:hypothetical protein